MIDTYKNPTASEFRKASANGAARGAKDHSTGDVYVWNGEHALHNDVIQSLPQNGMVDSAGTLWSYDDYKKLRRPGGADLPARTGVLPAVKKEAK
jgi:hypothetical protein